METQVQLKPLPSPDYANEQVDPPKQPKLTMKFLHELIKQMQQENRALAERVQQLEQQLEEYQRAMNEAAATEQMPDALPETDIRASDVLTSILIPRSKRHAPPKKRSLWALLFW